MAEQTRVIITDDLDGTEGARTYAFSWQDTTYEIDLSDAHRDDFLRALQPYIDGGRRTSVRRPRAARQPADRASR